MTRSAVFIDMIADALMDETAAGGNVYVPGDWPTYGGEYPYLRVQLVSEDRASQGRGTPVYLNTATFRIAGRLQALGDVGEQGADVESALWDFIREIEVSVINRPEIMRLVSQMPFIRSRINVNAEGAYHLGEICIDLGLEFPQGPEDFYPIRGVPVTEVTLAVVEPDHTVRPGLDIKFTTTP